MSNGYFITGNLFLKCSIKPRTYHFLIFLFVTFLEANQQFFPQLRHPIFVSVISDIRIAHFYTVTGENEAGVDPERLPFVWKTRKLRGKFKWSGSSRWKVSGKKVIPFEVLPFPRFYRNDRNFLYHLFGLLVPGFMSRESEKFTGIL